MVPDNMHIMPGEVERLMAIIEAIPVLTPEDRQELRVITWENYMSMTMAMHITATQRQVEQLQAWYDLPSETETPK